MDTPAASKLAPARAPERERRKDAARQVAVICAFCFMIVAALLGVGAFGGTPIQDVQDGALDADGSYLAPAGPAFGIWNVIYLGLLGYTAWQVFPRQRPRERQRALGALVAGTMVLNGLWLVAAQFASLPLTVLVIVLLLIALAVAFHVTMAFPGRGVADSVLIDGVTGLHLGWVTVATVANIAAWLAPATGEDGGGATGWGVATVVLIAVVGVVIAWWSRWRLAPGLAMGWGLVWIAVARLAGDPHDAGVGIAAIVGAVIVTGTPLVGKVLQQVIGMRNASA
ncbi:tryptophan-rich sensory protein [Microbacterium sp. CPCC 204701]|uniref:tryptophan-rich sensory protein n=1 Tax=Microbacterium sp. CPCC 204701 TaxID=2493084 RepID=UPI001F0B782E|nr:tryptophan-rich sensory protein [Microbacterium sp. CPCC 204701]